MMDLQNFETYLMKEERSDNTISCYKRDIKSFLLWLDKDITAINEFDLIRYKKYLNAKEKTVITANRKLASVNAFCRYLYDARLIAESYNVKLTKNRDKREYKGLTPEELNKLHDHILKTGNLLHTCIIELLMGTGIRVSELTGITLNDISLDENNSYIRVLGKGNVNRTLPLNREARQAVANYIDYRGEKQTQSLLVGQRGALGRGAVEIILDKYGEKLGIAITPHKLRHSLAYKLIKAGTPMTTIQQILGHESILTTNLYTQTTEQDKVDALADLVW
ncbi:MAG: tyrosine-type recombinase/integrase [Clostridiales bacterium]|nr:tyrosine-type recombinase/integrase [Clostridiales bacterium]